MCVEAELRGVVSHSHRVLVPFSLPDPEPVPAALVEDITAMEVVVLGNFELPEQTPASAGREQFGEEAQADLDEIAAAFGDGATVETRLVFGKDRAKTIDRVALEDDCDVILTGGAVGGAVDSVLVPLRGDDNLAGILAFVAELQAACDATVTLYHAADEDDRRPGEELLDDAVAELTAAGVPEERIERRLSTDGDPTSAIAAAGAEYDVVVIGESEPSLRERLFGATPARITAESERPVFVVRQVTDETQEPSARATRDG